MRVGAHIHKFGYNSDIGTTSDPEDVWDGGGLYTWPTTAGGMTISSTSVLDDGTTGTGARTVFVQGCSTAFAPLSETATLSSTGAVALTGAYYRVFRSYVVTAGSGGVNAGTITVNQSTDIVAQIAPSRGQTLMALYTVNDLSTGSHSGAGYLSDWNVSIAGAVGATANVSLLMRRPGEAVRTQDLRTANLAASASVQVPRTIWEELTVGTDIWVRVESVSANATSVSGGFDIVYSDPGRLYG